VTYPVHEVFASLQGEGLFCGRPQVFVRLEGCPLRCAWCDTPHTWSLPARDAAPRGAPPEGEAGLERAWSSAREVAGRVEALDPGGRRAVSLTGGEPLMWPGLALELRGLLPERRLHLETAGAFPESLERVLPAVDHVSFDHKLPADLAAPVPLEPPAFLDPPADFEAAPRDEAEWRATRRRVLGLLSHGDACAKLVVAGGRRSLDYAPILDDHAEFAPELPVVLQPATPRRGVEAPEGALLLELLAAAEARDLDARVLPQLHVHLGLR